MSKVLWLSDGGCTTGFGRVTHAIGERLVRDYGHDIHVLAVNHRGDTVPGHLDPSQPTPLHLYMPTQLDSGDLFGMSRVLEMLSKIEPEVVVTLNDPETVLAFLFNNRFDPQRILLQARPILSYIPCDGTNLVPKWTEILPKVTKVVAMSKWGQSHYEPSELVYHGVDADQFWPVDAKHPITTSAGAVLRSKKDCKRAFNFPPDNFLVGRVDTNSARKDYAALFLALVPVMQRHGDVSAHFHCAVRNPANGFHMENLLSRAPDIDRKRFSFPAFHSTFVGWPQIDMNALYNAFDVFVSPAWGEGFGLTLAEAAACGIPIIAQNVSAIPEVVGPGGILLEPQRLITVPSGEDQWLADIDAFTDAIERLYNSRGARRDLGQAGHDHVTKNFSWDVAASSFNGYITELAKAKPPVVSDTSED